MFKSKVKHESDQFLINKKLMEKLITKRNILIERAIEKSNLKRDRFKSRGQLSPRERLNAILDPDTFFLELYNMANYLVEDTNPNTSIPGANLIAGIGYISGVKCMIMIDDSGIKAGAASEATIDKALGCLDIALKQKLPCVHLVESAGVDLPNYSVKLWSKFGSVFYKKAKLSAAGIPVIAILHGFSTAGGAYQIGMSDYVIGVKGNGMAALAGSALLKAATGENATNSDIGGVEMHSVVTGSIEYLVNDDAESIVTVRKLIDQLNWNENDAQKTILNFEESEYSIEDLAGIVPTDYSKGYDVREVIARLVDQSGFIELKPKYGLSMVCAQAKIEGFQCGIIANNGPIDTRGATKAAQFIQLCDQAYIPLIFLSNVTGYMVGVKSEHDGMIKHGSKMIQAVSNARVPKITMLIGASFGAGNYGMCGIGYEPDFIFSWPNAKIGVMGGKQAAQTMEQVALTSAKKKNITLDTDELSKKRERIIEHYNKQSDIFFVSGSVLDHGIIDPRESRDVISFALKTCKDGLKRKLRPNSFGIARM